MQIHFWKIIKGGFSLNLASSMQIHKYFQGVVIYLFFVTRCFTSGRQHIFHLIAKVIGKKNVQPILSGFVPFRVFLM